MKTWTSPRLWPFGHCHAIPGLRTCPLAIRCALIQKSRNRAVTPVSTPSHVLGWYFSLHVQPDPHAILPPEIEHGFFQQGSKVGRIAGLGCLLYRGKTWLFVPIVGFGLNSTLIGLRNHHRGGMVGVRLPRTQNESAPEEYQDNPSHTLVSFAEMQYGWLCEELNHESEMWDCRFTKCW